MVDLALRHKIERARTHWLSLVGVEGVAWTAAALGIAALLCFHVDWNWALTAHQRIGCWAIGGGLTAGRLAVRPSRPCPPPRPNGARAARVDPPGPHLRRPPRPH